ncbi:MAG: nucleotidyltransferase family protein [Candidatus Zambryskibacteria bacterium]|nr:nucleotidyltransferase family protein [Candidatus Zambryskibacteria bacterium]
MKVIILAGGKGNRLMPITENLPKPLIKIGGSPIIDRIFKSLPDEITEVIIIVDHLKEKIKSYVGNNFYNYPVTYIDQLSTRGTFGALLSARDFLSPNERFLVINGDDIHNKNELTKYLSFNRSFGIQKMNMPNYHSIHLTEQNLLEGFYGQNENEEKNGALIANGVYVIDTNIFEHPGVILRDGESGLPHTILAQKDQFPVVGVETHEWIPINSFDDIERAEKKLANVDLNSVM